MFQGPLYLIDGPSLPPDEIISRHNVEENAEGIRCYSLCTAEPMCVGFNYRKITNKTAENCQLTNVTRSTKTTEKGFWILLRDAEAVTNLCLQFLIQNRILFFKL